VSFATGLGFTDAPAFVRAQTKERYVMGQGLGNRVAAALMAAAMSVGAGPAEAQDSQVVLPAIDVSSSRLGTGIVGTSTTVITAEDIARSPSASLQDIIGQVPGVQTWSTFGGVNGAGTVIDLRGFGATAASNTLVLINGRRLTDIDLGGVDFSSIPRQSIDRIEITRGNSGAVLYGEGAIGGVINIVTKNGIGQPPNARIEGGFGSFERHDETISAAASSGPFSVSAFGTAIDSQGYRVNNTLRQRDTVADFRYNGEDSTAYFNITSDDQHLGLPGARRVTPTSNELVTDRAGATTPDAFANKKGINVTLGATRRMSKDLEVILDGSVRDKTQDAFTSLSGFVSSDSRRLTTFSFTPRVKVTREFVGLPSELLAGVDFYDATFYSNRSTMLTDPPVHRYDLTQRTIAAYIQHTIGVTPNTDISYGFREESTRVTARDQFNVGAPGAFAFDEQAVPLNHEEWNYAAHFGIEHRFNESFSVFGRVAHSFRTPNVDERVGVNAFPVNFDLKTQTSRDLEVGIRARIGKLDLQSSVYDMVLDNEILFIPFPPIGANVNLDPTHRYGVENSVAIQLTDALRIKAGLTYTRAVFREGPFAGNDVPLVSKWTGNMAVSWDIQPKTLVMDVVARYVGARRMDNDQANFQPLIPAWTTFDVRLGGQYRNLFWSIAIQNLFNVQYFDYAVASSATIGRYNAYPQPGRTFLFWRGATGV
jgi:iron complex outermembrane receptor protein